MPEVEGVTKGRAHQDEAHVSPLLVMPLIEGLTKSKD